MDNCELCYGTGIEVVSGKGARNCHCRQAVILAQRLAKIPPRFATADLKTLQPDPTIAVQNLAIPYMKSNPESSYFLCGAFGKGKSLLLWALFRAAAERHVERLVVCTLAELLTEYKAVFDQPKDAARRRPRLLAEELRQSHTRFTICLDDLDKARPTEYAAEQLFELVNAIYEFGHQLIITTNLGPSVLADHFNRHDERYGKAIVRRVADGAKIYEF